jgi:Zn-finger in ubiquitin-hydrolases and other protein
MLMSLLDNLRFAIQRRRGPGTRAVRCGHLDQIRDVTRGSAGCEQCLALGDSWVHLRMCMTCGQVGCCDSSKNKHAHRHADQIGHRRRQSRCLRRSSWCGGTRPAGPLR